MRLTREQYIAEVSEAIRSLAESVGIDDKIDEACAIAQRTRVVDGQEVLVLQQEFPRLTAASVGPLLLMWLTWPPDRRPGNNGLSILKRLDEVLGLVTV